MPRDLCVSAINIYPVKSLAGTSMEAAQVQIRGLARDRRFVLVAEDGTAFTQRDNPKLSTLKTSVDEASLSILSNLGSVRVPIPSNGSPRGKVEIWYNETEAADCGDEVAAWFSEFVTTPVRLLYFDSTTTRKANHHAPDDDVSFADQYPVMVATEATLADLNGRLESTVPMNRFRPNLVISGAEALEEDNWTSVKIGDVSFRGVGNCKRCEVTTIDQERGERTGSEPLRTLASYRTIDRGAVFGRFLVPLEEGTIRVGDEVQVS